MPESGIKFALSGAGSVGEPGGPGDGDVAPDKSNVNVSCDQNSKISNQ